MADGANAIRRVFLRRVLYRIDFHLIPESVHESIFDYIVKEYHELFDDWSEESSNSFNLEINLKEINPLIKNNTSQKIFVFNKKHTEDCDGRTLVVSRSYMFLALDLILDTMGEDYLSKFTDIVSHLNVSGILKLNRIGLRKFNRFFILDEKKDSLNQIFSIPYFNEVKSNNGTFSLDTFKNMQVYTNEEYNLNFLREYSTGLIDNKNHDINNKLGHEIKFDFDLYSQSPECFATFLNDPKNTMTSMNDKIYKFFKTIVKDDIINLIDKGDLLESYNIII